MPSLNINKKDLEELGINLKDILSALSKSKNEVVKIKRKKRKNKKNKKMPKKLSPFPQEKQKFSMYPYTSGGGANIFNPTPQPITNTKIDLTTTQPSQSKEQVEYFKSALEQIKNDNQLALRVQENKLDNLAGMSNYNLLGLKTIYDKINNSNKINPLTDIQTGYYEEEEVNLTDRFGITPKNDFYTYAQTYTDNNEDETYDLQPPMEENTIIMEDIPQEDIDVSVQKEPQEQPQPQPQQENNDFFEKVNEEIAKRGRGRPKGSKNKSKNPLVSENNKINTRNTGQELINVNNQTPEAFAKQQEKEMTKQQNINKYFTPNRETKKSKKQQQDDESDLSGTKAVITPLLFRGKTT